MDFIHKAAVTTFDVFIHILDRGSFILRWTEPEKKKEKGSVQLICLHGVSSISSFHFLLKSWCKRRTEVNSRDASGEAEERG